MMTSSIGNISALLALCAGNSLVTGEFLAQRPVTRSFGVFFYLRMNKRVNNRDAIDMIFIDFVFYCENFLMIAVVLKF